MLKYKLITIAFFLKNLFAPSVGEKKLSGFKMARKGYKIERVGQMPDSVLESSALEIAQEGKSFWTLGDGGTKSQLFEVKKDGSVLSARSFPQLKNVDWEDMTKDTLGNIYIGDIGNNFNRRKNLAVYKIYGDDFNKVDTIRFTYEDQLNFPPAKEELNFDCEAMLWHEDSLYLFSKNRGCKWMNIYSLPAKPGNYKAKVVQKIYVNSMITAADISPDNKLVSLLTYGKIYFLKVKEGEGLRLEAYFTKKFNRSKQSEALVFTNETDLLVGNEQGMLFEVRQSYK